jgi:two-component system sensor histidine kinase VicK
MLTLEQAPTLRRPLTQDETQELLQLRQLVHHDLRTPLTSIIGFAELLLEREMTPEKRRQLIGFIAREGARLNALLDETPLPR